jgi:tRNA-Thr(GGU) m(6)t(6)A37 methyltransferase TsaA
MQLNAIGVIHSPYKNRGDAPRQGRLSDAEQILEVFAEYAAGLMGIEKAARLIVLYWGDRADRSVLQSPTPFNSEPVGVFSSRSPNRPNPIAFCVADLLRRDGNRLVVRGVDALDGSPLLDLKAYSPSVDSFPASGTDGPSHAGKTPGQDAGNV